MGDRCGKGEGNGRGRKRFQCSFRMFTVSTVSIYRTRIHRSPTVILPSTFLGRFDYSSSAEPATELPLTLFLGGSGAVQDDRNVLPTI